MEKLISKTSRRSDEDEMYAVSARGLFEVKTVGGNCRPVLYKKDMRKYYGSKYSWLAARVLRSVVVKMDGDLLSILYSPSGLRMLRESQYIW